MSSKGALAVVAVLTVVAFVLRLAGIDQGLFGDELFTYRIVTENGPWAIFGDVAHTAITPPLHYQLAWFAVQVGDPTVTIRLPSLILGTATVPLVYLLGLRTVGRSAALAGSAVVAISPFAIFYSVEARAYATLTFFSVLSTLALLRALRRDGFLSWLAYGALLAALLYTHYTGVFVVLGQLGWALWAHRDRARQLALVSVGVGLAYLPWMPSLVDQRELASTQGRSFTERFSFSVETIVEMIARVLPAPGEPSFLSVPLRELPGEWVVVVFWVTIGVALVAAIVRALRHRRGSWPAARQPGLVLIVVLTLVTPLGLILYSAQPDTTWLLARNLNASLPAFALLVGWLLTSLRPSFAITALVVMIAVLAVGTAKTLDDDNQRPPFGQVASHIDDTARAGDTVVVPLVPFAEVLFTHALTSNFKRAHEIRPVGGWRELPNDQGRPSWQLPAQAERVFIFVPRFISRTAAFWRAHLGERFALEAHRVYPGLTQLEVFQYKRVGGPTFKLSRRNGRDVIVRSAGAVLPVGRRPGAGFLELVSHRDHESQPRPSETADVQDLSRHVEENFPSNPQTTLSVAGWAIDTATRRPARLVAVFDRGRLVVAGRPSVDRTDLAKEYGGRLERSGFALTAVRDDAETLAKAARLRAFAISGGRAWELRPLSTDTFED